MRSPDAMHKLMPGQLQLALFTLLTSYMSLSNVMGFRFDKYRRLSIIAPLVSPTSPRFCHSLLYVKVTGLLIRSQCTISLHRQGVFLNGQ